MTVAESPTRPGDSSPDAGHPPDVPAPAHDNGQTAGAGQRGPWHWTQVGIDVVVVAVCAAFVFWQLHPSLILEANTPAGGDMGAHVWALAYLRDHLLPNGLLSGWTPDWYAGFPAFQFYMVVPFLAMVALNTGLAYPFALAPLALAAGLGLVAWRSESRRRRVLLIVAALALAVLGVSFPFGVAFKLVSVSGVVTMPVSAYFLARWAGLAFPAPAIAAGFVVAFLFDQNFTIYGGNIASTLAGEFAFSMSLSLCLVYLGVLFKGLRTGRHRGWAALLLALTGLTHLIPAFFALAATAVVLASHWFTDAFDLWRIRAGHRDAAEDVRPVRVVLRRWWWLATVGVAAALLSAFWVLPFFWRRTYLNDMGWEKKGVWEEGESFSEWFFGAPDQAEYTQDGIVEFLVPTQPTNLTLVAGLALVGAVTAFVVRSRFAICLAALALVSAAGFVWLPQSRLWNARVLPFWYLCLYLLAAVAVAQLARAVAVLLARDTSRPPRGVLAAAPVISGLVVLAVLGLSLQRFPFASATADGAYGFGSLYATHDSNFVPGWARWNYSGYEGKEAYPEFHEIMTTMAGVGREHGCGRALWEYESDKLGTYGTPMAPMLLPHWTDGCIGSMEGLYFEASSTTPFHFLMQSELSAQPSRAQRDMPYRDLSIDQGVEHLQLMGVRYYMAFSVEATSAARAHPGLTEIASTVNGWVVFEVEGSELVTPLENRPAVTTAGQEQGEWLCAELSGTGHCEGPALDWFQDSARWEVALAATGPQHWERVDWGEQPEEVALPEAADTDVRTGRDSISFDVDRTGVPVLVKASYFPNWTASGAEGPYRVAPNLMVVVPTEADVTLSYERTPVDWLALALTVFGIAATVLAFRRPALAMPARIASRRRWPSDDGNGHGEPVDRTEAPAPAASGAYGADGVDEDRGEPGAPVDGTDPGSGWPWKDGHERPG